VSTVVSTSPAQAGKSSRPCCVPGCKNLVTPPSRKCKTCQRRGRRVARAGTRGRSFGWGIARVLSASTLSASGAISVNGDFYRDRQTRGPNGECPFCGLVKCACASESEIRRARLPEANNGDAD